ncbi:MAG: protein kinase [Deltaproteobacteria bacterium]|nr:protein kinase [Deltaproteobacteria bacterium]
MIGEICSGYRLTRKLGEGGTGETYLAGHEGTGRKAAVKVLFAGLCGNAELVARFFADVKAASLVDHVGIADIYDCGRHGNGRAFVVQELLEGKTLSDALVEQGQVKDSESLADIAWQLATALAAAHGAKLVHGALKPDAIFLTFPPGQAESPLVKLVDFGMAKFTLDLRQSQTGSLLGAPLYMSPESSRGLGQADHRADIYALGCILFEMACGRPPFVREGKGELIVAHSSEIPPSVSSLEPAIPQAIDTLVGRMLTKSPATRPQSMAEVAAVFERFCRGPHGALPVSAPAQVSAPVAMAAPPAAISPAPAPAAPPSLPASVPRQEPTALLPPQVAPAAPPLCQRVSEEYRRSVARHETIHQGGAQEHYHPLPRGRGQGEGNKSALTPTPLPRWGEGKSAVSGPGLDVIGASQTPSRTWISRVRQGTAVLAPPAAASLAFAPVRRKATPAPGRLPRAQRKRPAPAVPRPVAARPVSSVSLPIVVATAAVVLAVAAGLLFLASGRPAPAPGSGAPAAAAKPALAPLEFAPPAQPAEPVLPQPSASRADVDEEPDEDAREEAATAQTRSDGKPKPGKRRPARRW